MESFKLIPYSKKYKNEVFPTLVPDSLYHRYTSTSFIYLFLSFLNLYKTSLYVLIDENNNRIIGSIAFRKKINIKKLKFSWYIYGVAISEEERGKGYGRILMNNALAWCAMKKIKRVYLKVAGNNIPAIELYNKMGFLPKSSGNNYGADILFVKEIESV